MQLPACLPVRYIFTLLAFVGFVFNYTLRININLVITSMVNNTALGETGDTVSDMCITILHSIN